ncbi:MAG: hypothetical protein ACJAZS_000167 [Alteromonas naphthalenivorans]|jgi:hypothetical protein
MVSTIFKKKNLYGYSLVVIALLVNILYLHQDSKIVSLSKDTRPGGMVWIYPAYSFYKGKISNYYRNFNLKKDKYTLYDEGDKKSKLEVFPIGDTMAYPIVASSIWKLFNKPSFLYLKIFNVVLFALSTFFLFQVCCFLFNSYLRAWCASLSVICFGPLIATNVLWYRDIFQYFGFIVFLYVFLSYMQNKNKSLRFLLVGSFLFTLCQWIRASLFPSFVILSLTLLFWGLWGRYSIKKVRTFLIIFWIANITLFWIPFSIFNYGTYGKFFVGPIGEAKLASLCAPTFYDGFHFPVAGHSKYVFERLEKGISKAKDYDGACEEYYAILKKKYPWQPIKALMYRIYMIFSQDIEWRIPEAVTHLPKDIKEKYIYAFSSSSAFLELLLRLQVRLVRLFGILGMLLALYRRNYFLLSLCMIGIVYSSGYMLLTHIEERILSVHVWPFALFAGSFLFDCIVFVFSYKRIQIKNHNKKIII